MEIKEFSVKYTFNLDVPEEVTVPGYSEKTEYVPRAKEHYVFSKDMMRDVLAWHKMGALGEGLFLTGPTGAGKSSVITQIAARLNIPLQQAVAHARLEIPELVGQMVVKDGSMEFQHGPLARAMKEGHWFLLDEMDLLDPSTAAGLNGVVEGSPLTIPENNGEVIHPHPNFRFIATGNTNGSGDRDGNYQGTTRQNMAFMDRFWVLHVDYPTEEQELKILSKAVPQLDSRICSHFIDIANMIRRSFVDEYSDSAIEVPMSTRALIRWVKIAYFFQATGRKNSIKDALDKSLTNRAEPETKTAIHEYVDRVFGEEV